jgi:hypothetical protein
VYPGSASVSTPATEEDSLAAIKLAAEAGVDLDAFNVNGDTAMHRAAARVAPIRSSTYLAERGARLDTKDRRGAHTAPTWHWAWAAAVAGGGPPQVRKTTADLLRRLMQARGTHGAGGSCCRCWSLVRPLVQGPLVRCSRITRKR